MKYSLDKCLSYAELSLFESPQVDFVTPCTRFWMEDIWWSAGAEPVLCLKVVDAFFTCSKVTVSRR